MQRAARRGEEIDLPPGPLRKFLERELRGEDPTRHGNTLRGEKLPGRLVLRRVPLGVDVVARVEVVGGPRHGVRAATWASATLLLWTTRFRETLEGSFSSVWTARTARVGAFCSIF